MKQVIRDKDGRSLYLCSRIPRPEFAPQRRNVDFRDEDGLDRWSVADDLRAQGVR